MHKYACFDQEITDGSKIHLPAVSAAVLYGRSVFTTLAVYESKPFQWSKHWRRLKENAVRLGIDLAETPEEKIAAALSQIINVNKVRMGRARISIFDGAPGGLWQIGANLPTAVLITTADLRRPPDNLHLTISPYPVNSKSPLAGVKSGNYLENLLALEEARRRGFDEAIRLNEKGVAVSGAMANVFWARGEVIFTPPLETGALSGTTRAFVLENFRVGEKDALPGELENADEIFLTSAGLGIARVQSFNKRNPPHSNAFSRILKTFEEFVCKPA